MLWAESSVVLQSEASAVAQDLLCLSVPCSGKLASKYRPPFLGMICVKLARGDGHQPQIESHGLITQKKIVGSP